MCRRAWPCLRHLQLWGMLSDDTRMLPGQNWHTASEGLGSSLALLGTAEMPEGVSWLAHRYTGLLVKHHIPAEKKPKELIPSPS